MLVRKFGTDHPVKRRFVPEERSTQPHYLENIKNKKKFVKLLTVCHLVFTMHIFFLTTYFYFHISFTWSCHWRFTFSAHFPTVVTSIVPGQFNIFQHVSSSLSRLWSLLPEVSFLHSLSPDTSNNTWSHPHCLNIKDGFLHSFLR